MFWIHLLLAALGFGVFNVSAEDVPELTSTIPLFSGELCPQKVILTCNAVNLTTAATISYFGSNNTIARYHHDSNMIQFPQPVSVMPPIENVTVQMGGVTTSNMVFSFHDFTLSADLSDMTQFIGQEISCGVAFTRSNSIRIGDFNISVSVPQSTLNVSYTAAYDSDGRLTYVNAEWKDVLPCDPANIYVVELNDSSRILETRNITNCSNGTCSLRIQTSTFNDVNTYGIKIEAVHSFVGIFNDFVFYSHFSSSIENVLTYDIQLQDCSLIITCETSRVCLSRYGFNSSYDEDSLMTITDDTISDITLQTTYFIEIKTVIEWTKVVYRLNYTTNSNDDITTSLIGVGVTTFVIGFVILLVGYILGFLKCTLKSKYKVFNDRCWLWKVTGVFSIFPLLAFIIALALWITVATEKSGDSCSRDLHETSIAATSSSLMLFTFSPFVFGGFLLALICKKSEIGEYSPLEKPKKVCFEVGIKETNYSLKQEECVDCHQSSDDATLENSCRNCGKYLCKSHQQMAFLKFNSNFRRICSTCYQDYENENKQIESEDMIGVLSANICRTNDSQCRECDAAKGESMQDEHASEQDEVVRSETNGDHELKKNLPQLEGNEKKLEKNANGNLQESKVDTELSNKTKKGAPKKSTKDLTQCTCCKKMVCKKGVCHNKNITLHGTKSVVCNTCFMLYQRFHHHKNNKGKPKIVA